MGVYIEGLDMPTSCGECHDSGLWSGISYLCKGGCFDDYSGCCAIGQAGCPLVEVKAPHGRLADVSENATYDARYDHFDDSHMIVAQLMLDDLPTIIESEGKDDPWLSAR